MADQPSIGDRKASSLDNLYSNYYAFCVRIGCPPASFDSWLRMEQRGFSGRLGSLSLSKQGHEQAQAAYRARLAAETASALQPYSL